MIDHQPMRPPGWPDCRRKAFGSWGGHARAGQVICPQPCDHNRMATISEFPPDEPFPSTVDPVIEVDLDLPAWAEQRNFKGYSDWMEGLGPFFCVELVIDGEPLVLFALEYHPVPGRVIVHVRPGLANRETRAVEMLRLLGVSGTCTDTATGTVHRL